jgi:hypothetical protein
MEYPGTIGKVWKSVEIPCNTSPPASDRARVTSGRYVLEFPWELTGLLAQVPQEIDPDRA